MLEKQLTRRLKTLGTLLEAVTAMKSLSAHHFLQARRGLDAARDYRLAVDEVLNEMGVAQHPARTGPAGLLLITSDLGLCGDYNTRLLAAAVEWRGDRDSAPLYVIGSRGQALLARKGWKASREYAGPASVDGLPHQLLALAEDLVADYGRGKICELEVLSARFLGAGRFETVRTSLLPIARSPDSPTDKALQGARSFRMPYQSLERLLAVAVREYLYIRMYQLLLESLASEHGMRLVAAENARNWIDDTQEKVKRRLAAVRREISTQEVLDIVSASRKRQSTI